VNDYLAILEPAIDGTWSAYVPDLPGCTSFGPTRAEAAKNVREAIVGHIAALRVAGARVPEPASFAESVSIA
jgi:predicted RNase H-like HicB family nuclease